MDRWKAIEENIEQSEKVIQILPIREEAVKQIRQQYQLKEESLLGAILLHSGGIVIENWLRFYGAGELNFVEKNRQFPYTELLVAEDILGGLFAVFNEGEIGYFAPDSLEWEMLDLNLSQLFYWAVNGDTEGYYQDYRWSGWKEEAEILPLDSGMGFYPFLWCEADGLESRRREPLPMEEMMRMEFDVASGRKTIWNLVR